MARWLVTGAGGALGADLLGCLGERGEDVVGLDRAALDVADQTAVNDVFDHHRPEIVVNAAAYTAVDAAESDEATATLVNGTAPGHLARWCADHGARLIHVSTDYVFDGTATTPYEVDDPTAPCNAYGRSKLAGEQAVLAAGGDAHVVRTAWVYGGGPSFVRAIGSRLVAGENVQVVTDQRGAPTWSAHLAQALIALGTADVRPGVLHCSASGEATWYDVALALAELLGADTELVSPTTSDAFVRPARRPAYSVLSHRAWLAAGLPPMAEWREALQDAVTNHGDRLIAAGR